MFSLDFRTGALSEALLAAVCIRRQAGGVSSASHFPREHWLAVRRGPEVWSTVKHLGKVFPAGEVLQNLFEHFPRVYKVSWWCTKS